MSKSALFYEFLDRERDNPKLNCVTMDKTKYNQLINKVKMLHLKSQKDGNDYRFLKRYATIEVDGVTKLISPVTDHDSIKYFVHDEDLYEVLQEAHVTTGHGGRDRMVKHLKTKYKNITYRDILHFLTLCEFCSQKNKSHKKRVVKESMSFIKELIRRCRVDVIDFQSKPDNGYKFILVYQDHLTKFIVLKALKTKSTAEICEHLLDIFTLLGAPSVLQADLGQEYVGEIMKKVVDFWPNFKIVYGKPRQNRDGGDAAGDVETMVTSWMKEHNTSNWSYGLKFVQLMKNSVLLSGMDRSPYESMFGCPPQHGLTTSILPTGLLTKLKSEDDLDAAIDEMGDGDEEYTEETEFVEEQGPSVIKQEVILMEQEHGEQQLDLYGPTERVKRRTEDTESVLPDHAKRIKRTSDKTD